MPDTRRHRGPHTEDRELFGPAAVPALRAAAGDLGWLLDRGYPGTAALKLVGDRFALRERQRRAVLRCACTAEESAARRARRVQPPPAAAVWIDGFNVVTTVEAALGGGVLLLGRDGALRDMASMHGSYRKVEETLPALRAIADAVAARTCRWLLDAPVSNSGRLRARILDLAEERGLDWTVDVVPDPDRELVAAADVVVATADAGILDRAAAHWILAAEAVARAGGAPWLVDLSGDGPL